MLAYIPAPWILWVFGSRLSWACGGFIEVSMGPTLGPWDLRSQESLRFPYWLTMVLVYLPTKLGHFYGVNVGKYATSTMVSQYGIVNFTRDLPKSTDGRPTELSVFL